jgi:hypothetical protein
VNRVLQREEAGKAIPVSEKKPRCGRAAQRGAHSLHSPITLRTGIDLVETARTGSIHILKGL